MALEPQCEAVVSNAGPPSPSAILHITAGEGAPTHPTVQKLTDDGTPMETCGDVYRGLARLGRTPDRWVAVLLCVDGLTFAEWEFFHLAQRLAARIPIFAYGRDRFHWKLDRARQAGAQAMPASAADLIELVEQASQAEPAEQDDLPAADAGPQGGTAGSGEEPQETDPDPTEPALESLRGTEARWWAPQVPESPADESPAEAEVEDAPRIVPESLEEEDDEEEEFDPRIVPGSRSPGQPMRASAEQLGQESDDITNPVRVPWQTYADRPSRTPPHAARRHTGAGGEASGRTAAAARGTSTTSSESPAESTEVPNSTPPASRSVSHDPSPLLSNDELRALLSDDDIASIAPPDLEE
jgi:hypothetical protein